MLRSSFDLGVDEEIPFPDYEYKMEEYKSFLDANRIDYAVVLGTDFEMVNEHRMTNDEYMDWLFEKCSHDDRYVPFISVDANKGKDALRSIERLVKKYDPKGIKVYQPFGITVGLLTGSVKGKPRAELLNQISSGGADLIVGTHALISDGVDYRNLGLVITDEQHRFGVNQRAALTQKGKLPHTLVMSATPIPRTLSLILYGDLELSVLDELPAGRKPIRTLLVDDSYRDRYLGFVRKTVSEGQQAYIVCPLVEDSDVLTDTMSATEYYDQLKKGPLSGIPVALVHGKMLSQEKAEVMEQFRTGKVRVLVSTTVIEVGVDCPNATLMIIENAERFGLSTLHQLRGRVGRGALQSWCVLVSSNEGETAQERLKLLTETEDGFAIAREDLRMRGPGDFLGSRQHGLPNLTVADLADDERVLIAANDAADELIRKDPGLSGHPVLKKNVERLYERTDATIN